jgi:demethylmenaquinone methyltransferase/2-methoxy-6-polyprenyl-1,4-benzoquinol methylase
MSALPAPEHKRAFVQAMFDRIAPRYDRMNRLMTFGLDRGWRRRALARLDLQPGERVIDLAAGTGDLTEEADRRGARAVGVDLAGGMLREARRRRPALSMVQGDGVSLPFRSGCAAAVTCGFALRNFADLPAVFAECARVLRPGGALLVLEVDEPASAWLRAAHGVHFRHVVPRLGAWLGERDAYRYLPESTAFLPAAGALAAIFEAAGFEPPIKHSHALGAVQCLIARRSSAAQRHSAGRRS